MRENNLTHIGLSLISLVGICLTWELLVRWQVYRFGFMPSPLSVIEAGVEYISNPVFITDVTASTFRILSAWFMAALIGIPLGLLIGWKEWANNLASPIVELLRPIPPIAWIPAGILFFPDIEASVVFICFIGCFFPIVLNTIVGVRLIDDTYFRAAHCLGSPQLHVLRKVVIPGALPSIVVGLAVGMGVNWMALVAAEMIAGDRGLGYRIWEAYSLAQYPRIVVGMAIIGVLGATMSLIIRIVGQRLLVWKETSAAK